MIQRYKYKSNRNLLLPARSFEWVVSIFYSTYFSNDDDMIGKMGVWWWKTLSDWENWRELNWHHKWTTATRVRALVPLLLLLPTIWSLPLVHSIRTRMRNVIEAQRYDPLLHSKIFFLSKCLGVSYGDKGLREREREKHWRLQLHWKRPPFD